MKKIKDCRNLAASKGNFSPDTLLAIRRAERYLQVARELSGIPYWNDQYKWTKNFGGKQEDIKSEITYLRQLLNTPTDGQINQRRSDAAFRYWRNKIEEKLGIFVFQFSMPEGELDGFSYAFDEFPYAIIINNQKAAVRKIFTLFHELAHIFKHSPGLCKTDDLSSEQKFNIELGCNSFAGEFLVPSESVKATESVDEIFEFAKPFNISGEVYLRRLLEEDKIGRSRFFELLTEVRKKSNNFPKIKQKVPISRLIQSKSTRGNKFFNLVTNATTTNQLSFSAASDLLGLKVGSIRQ
jgi:Zn-dependent peptidase ImmA (M78 family)